MWQVQWNTLCSYAFHTGAVEDFTIAVEQAPYFADGWKRRGQARSALGQNQEALEVLLVPCESASGQSHHAGSPLLCMSACL